MAFACAIALFAWLVRDPAGVAIPKPSRPSFVQESLPSAAPHAAGAATLAEEPVAR
jgi:hypothetical protein